MNAGRLCVASGELWGSDFVADVAQRLGSYGCGLI